MKPTLFALALGALLGLATPGLGETQSDRFSRCIEDRNVPDATEECVILRSEYRSNVRACMAELKAASVATASANGATSAVGARARFLICTARVRETFVGVAQ